MKSILNKLRNYEIEIRKTVNSQFAGDHYSVFKGQGIEFDDVRLYQYGDDVRAINWNVTAKGHGVYVKTFNEEREQFVYFIYDVSASEEIGSGNRRKKDLGNELCGVLALAAARQMSKVGLICYSSQREKYIQPDTGEKHAVEIINSLYRLNPKQRATDLKSALIFALSMIKRKSIIFLISDFIDEGYEKHLMALALKHDLIVIHIADKIERELPRMGIIPVVDKETGKLRWVNTSSDRLTNNLSGQFEKIKNELSNLCHKYQADYLMVDTKDDLVDSLIHLFNKRNKSFKK